MGIVVGAILAPTDPVLAADVQVEHPFDTHRVRSALAAEASLNDGTAFPFLLLGLALLGTHDPGAPLSRLWPGALLSLRWLCEPLWWHWIAVDVSWASAAGLGIGAGSARPSGRWFSTYAVRTAKPSVWTASSLSGSWP